jgi:aminotransferase
VVPGDAFGPGGAGHVRCAYATGLAQIELALDRMARFLEALGVDANLTRSNEAALTV